MGWNGVGSVAKLDKASVYGPKWRDRNPEIAASSPARVVPLFSWYPNPPTTPPPRVHLHVHRTLTTGVLPATVAPVVHRLGSSFRPTAVPTVNPAACMAHLSFVPPYVHMHCTITVPACFCIPFPRRAAPSPDVRYIVKACRYTHPCARTICRDVEQWGFVSEISVGERFAPFCASSRLVVGWACLRPRKRSVVQR